jgi:hypothetical protein
MRKVVNVNDNEGLDVLIPEFGKDNDTVKELKKVLDAKGIKIKALMAELSENKYIAGDYIATYVVKESSSMDEDKLLKVFNENRELADSLGIIKTKEYVDMDALESALYHNKLDDLLEDIGECKTTKRIPTLTVKKLKEKK